MTYHRKFVVIHSETFVLCKDDESMILSVVSVIRRGGRDQHPD